MITHELKSIFSHPCPFQFVFFPFVMVLPQLQTQQSSRFFPISALTPLTPTPLPSLHELVALSSFSNDSKQVNDEGTIGTALRFGAAARSARSCSGSKLAAARLNRVAGAAVRRVRSW